MSEPVQTKPKNKPGRPPKAVDVTQTQEFKAALAVAAQEAAANILKTLQESREEQPGDVSFAEKLGLAIAQLSHQGTGRGKPVDPAILRARDEARARMTDLILEARKAGQVPLYELRNKVYLDETLVDPVYIDPASKEQRPTQIEWPGVPSEAMIPANDVAKAIHGAFSESIGVVSIDHSKHLKPEVFGVTPGGLVVKGAGHALRPMQVGNQSQAAESTGEGLKVHGPRGSQRPGQQKTIAVLGTVAAPARVGQV